MGRLPNGPSDLSVRLSACSLRSPEGFHPSTPCLQARQALGETPQTPFRPGKRWATSSSGGLSLTIHWRFTREGREGCPRSLLLPRQPHPVPPSNLQRFQGSPSTQGRHPPGLPRPDAFPRVPPGCGPALPVDLQSRPLPRGNSRESIRPGRTAGVPVWRGREDRAGGTSWAAALGWERQPN